MPNLKEYTVSLDSTKVIALSKTWETPEPNQLMKSLVDLAYRHYVEEGDGLMSTRAHLKEVVELRQKIEELSRTIEVYKEKHAHANRLRGEKRLCPTCQKRVRYDAVEEVFTCANCGWRGEVGETILEE